MKTGHIFPLIVIYFLSVMTETLAQGTPETKSIARQKKAADKSNTVELARSMNNVNYTDVYDRSLLMYAASKGYSRACRILLRRGADPNIQAIDGATSGMFAAYNGFDRIVGMMLQKGFDPEIKSLDGTNALMMASQNGHLEVARLLLSKGAKPNLQAADGYTALMLASQNGHDEIVSLLLQKRDHCPDSGITVRVHLRSNAFARQRR